MPTKTMAALEYPDNSLFVLPNQQLVAVISISTGSGSYLNVETVSGYPGDSIHHEIEVPSTGFYTFEIEVIRSRWENRWKSLPTITRVHIGENAPLIYQDHLRLTKVKGDNALDLSLKVINDSSRLIAGYELYHANQGWWYDPQKVSFDIFRNGELVAQNYKGTNYIDAIEQSELTGYKYSVDMYYDGVIKAYHLTTESNVVAIGQPKEVPFEYNIDDWNLWTKIHSTNLPRTFSWDSNATGISTSIAPTRQDAWIFTPPINFEKGVYRISFDYRDGVSIKDFLTNPIIYAYFNQEPSFDGNQRIQINGLGNSHYESFITANESLVGYCGFNVLFNQDFNGYSKEYINIQNFKIEKYTSLSSPDHVENLKAQQVEEGSHNIKITFVTPNTDVAHNPITNLTKVEVYRSDTTLVQSFVAPDVNQELSFVDTNTEHGWIAYKVVAWNEAGKGFPAVAKVWAGYDTPQNCHGVKLQYENGKGTLSWDAVDPIGINGYPVGDVTYKIMQPHYNSSNQLVYDIWTDTIKSTHYTFEMNPEEGAPRTISIYVSAVNKDGVPAKYYVSNSNIFMAGNKKELPVLESISSDGQLSDIYMTTYESPRPKVYYSWSLSDKKGFDNKPGRLDCTHYGSESIIAELVSQNINLGEAQNPVLSFYLKNNNPGGKKAQLTVYCVKGYAYNEGHEFYLGDTIDIETLDDGEWHLFEFPMNQLVGEDVIWLSFVVNNVNNNSVSLSLDDIHIWDKKDRDLVVSLDFAPTDIAAGETRDIEFSVSNYGYNSVKETDYAVKVYRDGEYFMSLPSVALAPYDIAPFSMAVLGQPFVDKNEYRIVAEWKHDQNPDNNAIDVSIDFLQSSLPKPLNLVGAEQNGKSSLQWEEPQLSGTFDWHVIDGSENYGDYNFGGISEGVNGGKLGEWTVINGNGWYWTCKMPTGLLPMAWASINPDSLPDSWMRNYDLTPFKGERIFYSGTVWPDEWNELPINTSHWLISPRLNGKAQTIRFWAKSSGNATGHPFWVGYTTDDSDPLLSDSGLLYHGHEEWVGDTKWTQFSFEVPEGAIRFAIEHTKDGLTEGGWCQSGLCIDDIEFTVEGDANKLKVQDYNVYRDNKVIATGVTDTHYVDVLPKPGVYTYRVSANYAEAGESALSNEVELFILNPTGPDDPYNALEDLTADGQVTVRPISGGIEVCNASDQQVSVYNVAGQLMARVTAHSDVETIALAPGIYLVTAGNRVGKILVK